MRETSDGSTASYYELPEGCSELQHLISYRNMNAQIGEIFRACYRYGQASHSGQLRDAKKILFYAQAEIERLTEGKENADTKKFSPSVTSESSEEDDRFSVYWIWRKNGCAMMHGNRVKGHILCDNGAFLAYFGDSYLSSYPTLELAKVMLKTTFARDMLDKEERQAWEVVVT